MLPLLFYFFLGLLLIFPLFFFFYYWRFWRCVEFAFIYYIKKDHHHHVHDTRRYIVTLIWLFAPPYTIIGKQQIKWNKKKGRTSEIETPRVFNIVCSLSKDWRKSSQKKNSIDNSVSVRPSVRDPMVKQTWTSYLYIYSQIHPENRLPYICFFFQICAIMQTRNRVKRNRRARPVGLYKGQRLAAI